MTWCLLTCVTAIVTTIIILHISVEFDVGGHLQTFLFLDGCFSYSSKHNQPSPTSQQAIQISSLRVSDRWRFQSQGPKDDISEMCGVWVHIRVCVSCWSCWGANYFAKHNCTLGSNQEAIMPHVLVIRSVSVSIILSQVINCTKVWKSIHSTWKKIRDPSQ